MGTLVSNRGALFLNFYQLVIHRLFSCFLFLHPLCPSLLSERDIKLVAVPVCAVVLSSASPGGLV